MSLPCAWVMMAVPERCGSVEFLRAQIPSLRVIEDTDHAGNRVTMLRAWQAGVETGAAWVGVLQDDILLCDDFPARAVARLREAQDLGARAVSFYSQRRSVADALARGDRWWQQPAGQFCNDQAVALTRDLADRLVEWIQPHLAEHRHWSDVLLADFLAHQSESIWQTSPSLVQHRLDLPSVIGCPPLLYGQYVRQAKTWSPAAS